MRKKNERTERLVVLILMGFMKEINWFERTEACIVAFAHFRGANN